MPKAFGERHRWLEDDLDTIVHLLITEHSNKQIAERFSVTVNAIECIISVHGLMDDVRQSLAETKKRERIEWLKKFG